LSRYSEGQRCYWLRGNSSYDESYIFISYAHDDAERVYPIIKNIYEAGWDLWYDEGIKITERYLPVIADHVKRCKLLVLMLTNRCLERPFVINYELEYARQRGIQIITIRLETIEPPSWLQDKVDSSEALLERLRKIDLPNRRTRVAVPPAVKQNVVYDVVLPPELPGFEYSVKGDKITITKYVGNDTEVIIPDVITTLDGNMIFQITGIGPKTFSHSESLTTIVISDSIANISYGFIDNCPELGVVFNASRSKLLYYPRNNKEKSYNLPDGITSIGDHAFLYCTSLASITILGDVITFDKRDYLGISAILNSRINNRSISQKPEQTNNVQITDPIVQKSTKVPDSLTIPHSKETPRALICCAENDVQHISMLLTELYWESFNFYYKETANQQVIKESQCVLVFFSEHTAKCKKTMNMLKEAIKHDVSHVIQIFLTDCDWLDDVKNKLHDR